jgi:hypothetical protein
LQQRSMASLGALAFRLRQSVRLVATTLVKMLNKLHKERVDYGSIF